MKKDAVIIRIIKAIMDPEREFRERVYLALTVVCEVTAIIALLGDIVLKENPYEIWVIVGAVIFIPGVMLYGFRRKKIEFSIKVTVLGLVFLILPGLYFFGGGIRGGGIIWFIFTFTYAGLVLAGAWRIVTFVCI